MKQLVVNALVSLVTGMFFVLGIAGAAFIVERLYKSSKEPPKRPAYINAEALPEAAFFDHAVVDGVPFFTVKGTVRNDSETVWNYVDIVAALLVDETTVNTCRYNKSDLSIPPKSSVKFLIECRDIAAEIISPKIRYKLRGVKEQPALVPPTK